MVFQNLKDVIRDALDLVFVSDRHKAIEKALHIMFLNVFHSLHIYYVGQNI